MVRDREASYFVLHSDRVWLVGSSSAGSAAAQSSTVFLTPAIASTAPEIVNGFVAAITPVEVDGYPHTIYQVEVTEALLGERSGSVLVQVPGGPLSDGMLVVVSHQPQFEQSDQVQLALAPTETGVDAAVAAVLGTHSDIVSVYGGIDGAHWFDGDAVSSAEAAGDFVLHGARWAAFPVGYQVNPANSGVAADAALFAVRRAFDRWQDDRGSNVEFLYGGTSQRVDDLYDGVNVVSWVHTDQRWVAEAAWLVHPASGTIAGFDIRINRATPWAVDGVPGRFDIETVVAHEVGHVIGLSHSPASNELMYWAVYPGFVNQLGAGDRAGARALYPEPNPLPGVPRMVRSTGWVGLTQIISWSSASGAGVFNTYTLQRSTDGQNWTDVQRADPGAGDARFALEGVHQFRVRATNSLGDGAWGYSVPIAVATGVVRPVPLDGQIDRLYQAYFLRPPDGDGLSFWRARRVSGVELSQVSSAFASSDEFAATYGSLTDGEFVDLVYQNVLGRAPDAPGRAFWMRQLAGGVSRGAVMIGFSESSEMIARTGTVGPTTVVEAEIYRLYVAFFLRFPDPAGFQYWVGVRQSGRTLESIAADFAGSPEFVSTYGSLPDYRFVELAYANVLARTPDVAGAVYWEGRLAAGVSRGAVMVGFSESPEFILATGSLP